MRIKITLIYLVFCTYWLSTIFFTFPENYLQIKAIKYEKIFSLFLYQRWSFFAPPPKTNDRLYFQYISIKKDTLQLEVLKPLAEKRKQEFLFNSDRSVIDYVLANNIYALSDYLREGYNNYKFEKCGNNISEKDCNSMFLKEFYPKFHEYPELKSLLNYGILISNNNKLIVECEKIKIISTTVNIKKFNERYTKKVNTEENLVFETQYFNIKNNKWEN
jgi:hypothetical protein